MRSLLALGVSVLLLAVVRRLAVLALLGLLGGCIHVDRATYLSPAPPRPDWSTIHPSGDVQCWPQKTLTDRCRWSL